MPILSRGVGARLATTTTSPSEESGVLVAVWALAMAETHSHDTAIAAAANGSFTAELPWRTTIRRVALGEGGRINSHESWPPGPAARPLSPLGSSARATHPGCSIGRPRQAGLLACGLSPGVTFPDSSGLRRPANRLQLRGQPGLLTRVPVLIPFGGTCRAVERCLIAATESTGGDATPAAGASRRGFESGNDPRQTRGRVQESVGRTGRWVKREVRYGFEANQLRRCPRNGR